MKTNSPRTRKTSDRHAPISSREVFIVRLSNETRTSPTWLGQVQNVRTGHQVVIHSLLDLLSCFEDFFPEQDDLELPAKKLGLK